MPTEEELYEMEEKWADTDVKDMLLISRKPTHPGEILREDFMVDYGLSVAKLAKLLGVSRQSVNELIREHRAVSPDMALRLARLFCTTPQYWLNLQRNVDLWDSLALIQPSLKRVHPLPEALAASVAVL